jgi:hypothetical protein
VSGHTPRRGSDVEAYIRGFRDMYPKGTPWWATLDELLDDYRLRADTGLSLGVDISLSGQSGGQP